MTQPVAGDPGKQSGGTSESEKPRPAAVRKRRSRIPRWLRWTGGVTLLLVVTALAAVAYVVHNAEPILRRRVIATLEDRFQSPVELDALHISVVRGLEVAGSGLRILSIAGPAAVSQAQPGTPPANREPMLSVNSFSFRTGVRQLFEPTMRVLTIRVQGMHLTIPPKQERGPIFANKKPPKESKWDILVDEIVCSDMVLTIDTDKPGKLPLVFPIHDITLYDVGAGKPFNFEASLVNPKPVGDIRSTGHFGPWHPDQPRDSPVDGQYAFTHADLGTIKGISGTLSSTGNYSGSLGEIGVTGTTDTPDFALDVSEHPVDLRSEFNATVDGTTGDTRLNTVKATLLHTVLNVSGNVIRAADAQGGTKAGGQAVSGHLIDIAVASDQARVEDILTLGAKTSPPLMRGALTLRAHLTIPPGNVSVSQKMRIDGKFTIHGVTFSNASWQQTVDKLSLRAQGDPQESKTADAPAVASQMGGSFALANALVNIPTLSFQMPGAQVNLAGKYSLDGQTFDFAGTVRTKATVSAMLTGWKSILATPFDPLFKKNGAGLEVPITISGTRSAPKLGIDAGKLAGQIFSRHKKQDQPDNPVPPAAPQPAPPPH